jgi:hypothetical protein
MNVQVTLQTRCIPFRSQSSAISRLLFRRPWRLSLTQNGWSSAEESSTRRDGRSPAPKAWNGRPATKRLDGPVLDVAEVLGSRSTYSLGAIGGFNGRKLEAGDVVPVGSPRDDGTLPEADTVPEEFRPVYAKEQTVRIVLGLYDHRLTEEGLDNLLTGEWKVTPVADRMGLRYSSPGVTWKEREQPFGAASDPSNIIDAGYAVTSIQIPGGTQPIILHRDAVSGGGYAMVGTVISADMDPVARAATGTATRLVMTDRSGSEHEGLPAHVVEDGVRGRQEILQVVHVVGVDGQDLFPRAFIEH